MISRQDGNPVALIVNGHHAVRRALCDRIRASFDHFRLLQAATLDDALFILGEIDVDIVLLDGEHAAGGSLSSTRAILERAPNCSVVMMSAFSEPTCRSAASRAGAIAFVSKRAIGAELPQVLAELTRARGLPERVARSA